MHDIVYFVKDSEENEELRYSLRSLKNFPHRKVWFYGGCPSWARPDHRVRIIQNAGNKYDNVHRMLASAAHTTEISPQFYWFNDDFFVMEPVEYAHWYRGSLYKYIVDVENRAGNISAYTRRLRRMVKELETANLPTRNYEMHVPLLVDRKKLQQVLSLFPGHNGVRSLYGNYHRLDSELHEDVKVFQLGQETPTGPYISTADNTFKYGKVGEELRREFPDPSPYEIQ